MEYVVSEGALVRRDDGNLVPEVWWPEQREWHVLPELESWYEGRPVTEAEVKEQFPQADLEAEVVYDTDWPEGAPGEPV